MANQNDFIIELTKNKSISLTKQGHGTRNLLVFPGTPGSRYFKFIEEDVLNELDIRIYTMDRPGYGHSTPQTGRTVLDWADDIKQIINLLDLTNVSVLGYSGGAPFAFACAYKLADKISKCTIVAGCEPYYIPTLAQQKLSKETTGILSLVNSDPQTIKNILIEAQSDPKQLMEIVISTSSAPDKAIYSSEPVYYWLYENFKEAIKPNGEGCYEFANEFILLFTDWQIPLDAIKTPVELWYGKKDAVELHSVNHGEYLEQTLPNAKRHVFENEGSALLWSKAKTILESCF